MKKILCFGLMAVMLTGCGSNEEGAVSVNYNTLDVASYDLYDGEEFRLQYPVGWDVKEKEEVVREYNSSAEIAIVSGVADAFFTPNMLVEKVVLPDGVNGLSKVYEGIESENKKSLLLYSEVDRSEFTTIVNGVAQNGLLVQFKGKRKLETDIITYLQAVLVDNASGVAYVATVAFDELDSNVDAAVLVESLKTFAVK